MNGLGGSKGAIEAGRRRGTWLGTRGTHLIKIGLCSKILIFEIFEIFRTFSDFSKFLLMSTPHPTFAEERARMCSVSEGFRWVRGCDRGREAA